jgi:hypothetical protein
MDVEAKGVILASLDTEDNGGLSRVRPPLRAIKMRKYDKITRSPKKASDAPRVFVKILN